MSESRKRESKKWQIQILATTQHINTTQAAQLYESMTRKQRKSITCISNLKKMEQE